MQSQRITIRLASDDDRAPIYRIRHSIYASELAQHPQNEEASISDSLDAYNSYLVAVRNHEVLGFVSITPPSSPRYSIDKYLLRSEIPICFDDSLYEVRILSVIKKYRGSMIALVLMYAAFRWIEAHGGTTIVSIGRLEVVGLYERIGLKKLGMRFWSGKVEFELMAASTGEIQTKMDTHLDVLRRIERSIHWRLAIPFFKSAKPYHGGASLQSV